MRDPCTSRRARAARAALACAAAALAAALAAAGVSLAAAPGTIAYKGTTSQHGAVSFTLQGTKVINFRFVNACPADSNAGTLVPVSIAVRAKRFSYRDPQFAISGTLSGSNASGTAHDTTGDCDSGVLRWTAKRA